MAAGGRFARVIVWNFCVAFDRRRQGVRREPEDCLEIIGVGLGIGCISKMLLEDPVKQPVDLDNCLGHVGFARRHRKGGQRGFINRKARPGREDLGPTVARKKAS